MPECVFDLATDECVVAFGDGGRRLHPLVVLLLALQDLVELQSFVLEPLDLLLQRCNAVIVAQFSRRLILLLPEPLELILDAEHVSLNAD